MRRNSMAEQYDNTNRFVLFKNNKEKESQPDYTGTITLEGGKEMKLAAWIRESKAGVAFLSGQMSEPYNGGSSDNHAPREVAKSVEEVVSDIPF